MPAKVLSKSRYLNGLQCPKLLWIATNDPKGMPAVDAATQHVFDEGHLVGELAHEIYRDGMNLHSENIGENLKETLASLSLRKPLFEAGFSNNRLYCRTDILTPASDEDWDIVEVKSSTEVKDEHLHDVAFQRHVCKLAGLAIGHCHVMHLNREYTKHGEIDPHQLFVIEDVTDRLDTYTQGIEDRIEGMLQCIRSANCPAGTIGRCCGDPYPCALQADCWAHLPHQNVMTLNYGKKLGEELLACGILDIRQIPVGVSLSEKQRIQKDCAICNRHHIKPAELRGFLKKLTYPLHFIDFETFRRAIPLYDGTRPHQNIPFQFSLHTVKQPGGEPQHHSYLAQGEHDPRPGFMAALAKVMGQNGTILVYNQAFEKTILTETAQFLPEYQGWVGNLLDHVVDLMAPFKGFLYYHPDQCGSVSLKQVLPALTGISYDRLDISDGEMASLAYMQATFGGVTEEERQQIRAQLEVYCGQDSGGMVEIVDKLRELAIN